MNTYIKSITVLALLLKSMPVVTGQGLGLPSVTTLEQIAKDSGVLSNALSDDTIIYEDKDFDPPARGKIRMADVKIMKKTYANISTELLSAPNGDLGKNSQWYLTLIDWNQGLEKASVSELEHDLFLLLPKLLEFVERDAQGVVLANQLKRVETYMVQSGDYVIRALSYHIAHEQGVVATDLLRQAVRLFGNGQLVDETAWDVDDPMPVDAAGIFILNPGLAVEELKKRPVKRVRYFLANITEPAEFFERYVGEGDGLEVLKAKYAANRAVIDAKHREVVAWLAAQPKE